MAVLLGMLNVNRHRRNLMLLRLPAMDVWDRRYSWILQSHSLPTSRQLLSQCRDRERLTCDDLDKVRLQIEYLRPSVKPQALA